MTRIEPRVLTGGNPVLAYDVGGSEDARPLVLLHGLSANSTSWAAVIVRTARGWRSHALDFRGHGRSDRTPGRYRLEDYIDDADRLLQMIGQPAVVVGHSLGAIVAAALAQDRHPLVAAVFLEDPPLYVVEPVMAPGSVWASTAPRSSRAPTPTTTPPSDPTTRTGCTAPRPTSTWSRCLALAQHPRRPSDSRPLPRRPRRLPHPPDHTD